MSDLINIKNVLCHAKNHSCFESGRLCTYDELLLKIAEAAKNEDVSSVIFYFTLEQERSRHLLGDFCMENYDESTISFVSRVVADVLKQKCRKIYESKYPISKIWVGRNAYSEIHIWKIDVAVVVTKESTREKDTSLWGFDILLVSENECSSEALALLQHEQNEYDPTFINENEVSDLLNDHSNISLINISNVRSTGFYTDMLQTENEQTLVIYCHVKGVIPLGERGFPRNVSGYPVDVREGTCSLAVRGLRMSETISADNCAKRGTLGGFVDLQSPPRKAFITCAHVVLPTNALQTQSAKEYIRRREIARVYDKEKNEIGKITHAVFDSGQPTKVSVDAALVEITDRNPSDGYFDDVFSEYQLNGAGKYILCVIKIHIAYNVSLQMIFTFLRNSSKTLI
jgi:hypothetical protein